MSAITLHTTLENLVRINDYQARALKRLGLITVADLLHHFPSRYSDVSIIKPIGELSAGEIATVFGTVTKISTKKSFRGKMPMAEATIEEISGKRLKAIWFNQPYIAKMLESGQPVKMTGKISENSYGLSMMNPEFDALPELPIDNHDSLFASDKAQMQRFGFPVYRESRGITSKWFYHAIGRVLRSGLLDTLVDPLPETILQKYSLPSIKTALIWIHAPEKESDSIAARKRFAFQEVFMIQLGKFAERKKYQENFAYQLKINRTDVERFIDRFPFTPTDAQSHAIDTILADIAQDKPMSRLLEGDVGSGKTFVAATITHAAVTNNPEEQDFGRVQVGYMAPTEVLATQLFENFIQYFTGSGIQIALMTGAGCKKFPSKVNPDGWTDISKNQLLKWIANGEIPIVIGTHALIQKKVTFKHLGLVIIDEQHRFGTNQRMKLAKKDGHVPHYLSMTATPIPRTLALTIYGDLDLTVIDQMPAGRKPVQTTIVADAKRKPMYDAIGQSLADGRQAYVICPRIDEPDPTKERALQLKSVKAEAKRLGTDIFAKYRIGIMHSKMNKKSKEAVMEQFANHEIDILVSTSVVEVGVNVPNATSIIIEGAERFGLAQLHQLRGRVLRSSHQAYCYLVADAKSEKTRDRLKAIVQAKNGFELAEMDLLQRGAGDLAGRKQWGITDLGMEAIKNVKMVEAARTEAGDIIAGDQLAKYPLLQEMVQSQKIDIHLE